MLERWVPKRPTLHFTSIISILAKHLSVLSLVGYRNQMSSIATGDSLIIRDSRTLFKDLVKFKVKGKVTAETPTGSNQFNIFPHFTENA